TLDSFIKELESRKNSSVIALVSGNLLIYLNFPGTPGPVVPTGLNLNDAINEAERVARRRSSSPRRAKTSGNTIIFSATFNNNALHRVGWIPPQ
ncbi:hypothetical protein Mgra_00002551, partial [Meloidogyne graminicola]